MKKLAENFVLCADEVWRLQGGMSAKRWRERGGTDRECITFQDLAAAGHAGPGPGSKQGIYVCTPTGAHLASINSRNPSKISTILRRGLAKWKKLPRKRREEAPKNYRPTRRIEQSRPRDGLVLTSTVRYLPTNRRPTGKREQSFNHDQAWFSKGEARSLFPDKPRVGDKHAWPDKLIERLTCYHLIDSVVGETPAFPRYRASGAIETEVMAIENGIVELRFRGNTEAKGLPRSSGRKFSGPARLATRLLGSARVDIASGRYYELELVALGTRWLYDDQLRGKPRFRKRPIGWTFSVTEKDAPWASVAPAHVGLYGAAWLRPGSSPK